MTTALSTSVLAKEVDKSQWPAIFEANYNNQDKASAATQRK
jgi:hypothetical protein